MLIGPAIEYQIGSALAFDGTNYLVVWGDYRSYSSYDIYGARVAVDGTILDEGGFIISDADGHQENPAVAFDGNNFLVVWRDGRGGSIDIYGSRVSPAGGVLDPDGIPVCADLSSQGEVAVAFDDSACLVVWTDLRDGNDNIYGARVDGDGTVLDPTGIAICSDAAVQRYPAVASNGMGWLVVWMDRRSGQPDIYGARVSNDGTVLDASGIPVAATSASESYPVVAYNETDCLVVWDIDAGATSHDIYGARVDSAGAVLDSVGIAISAHPDYQGYPAASSDGTNYFVIWADIRNSITWNVYGARVDPGGAVVDTAGLPVCLEGGQQFGLAIAFGGPSWLITWHDSRNDHKDIFGIRVATDGAVLDAASFLIGSSSVDQTEPSMAFDGTNYFVVWHEWREGSLYDVRGTRVSMDGTVLDPAGIAVSTHSGDSMYPAVSFISGIYLVVWQDRRYSDWDIRAARVTAEGTVLDTLGFTVSVVAGAQERPALACNRARWLVVWQDKRSGIAYDIYGCRVTKEGNIYEPAGVLISDAFGHQGRPSVSSDGLTYLAVWEDGRNGQNDIIGTRVSNAGTVLDSAGIAISIATYAQERPDVIFDGDRYVAVWQDNRTNVDYDIYMSRIDMGGTVLDPSGILVSGAVGDQMAPSVTFNSRNYVAIWQDGRTQSGYDIHGARVDTSGIVMDPGGFEVSGAPHHQMTPDLSPTPLGVILMCYSSFIPDPGYGSYRMWASLYDVTAGVPGEAAGDGFALLYPNFPNPFRSSTTLRFRLVQDAEVGLKVYDVYGRLVATLMEGSRDAGVHTVTWDTGSAAGGALAPGLYFLSLRAGTHHETRKLLLLK